MTPLEYVAKVWGSTLCIAPLLCIVGNAVVGGAFHLLYDGFVFMLLWATFCGIFAGSPIFLAAFFIVKFIDKKKEKSVMKKIVLMLFCILALIPFHNAFTDIEKTTGFDLPRLQDSYMLVSFAAIAFYRLPSRGKGLSNLLSSS